ncbi:MAG: hypothetical protein LC797_17190 [Chloroflexi bacterium]|nr:hypothetical protein [Chloroflexota bacterium]
MLDVITLQARGQYKQEEYLQQAAHERLVHQLGCRVAHAPATRTARLGQLGSALVGVARFVLALIPGPATTPVSGHP